jgi:hypothetical protein
MRCARSPARGRPIAALVAAALLVAVKLQAQTVTSSRFHDPEGITADPTGLRRDTSVKLLRPGPRYPRDQESMGTNAAPVVAYVIDTTGRIELETVSFLNASAPEFIDAVCAFLPAKRFEPFVVADQKWRVLLVEMYGFNHWKNRDTTMLNAATLLEKASQEEFATSPMSKVVGRLDPLPHCPTAKR